MIRFMAFRKGRCAHFLSRTEQIPLRVRPRVAAQRIHILRPVAVALVTEEFTVFVIACRPDADPAFKVMIDADAHR